MSGIKYHEYRAGEYDYGEDHSLTNNWNPDLGYGNEYAKVYFNVESKGYSYPQFSFNDEDRAAFDAEVERIFSSIGWTCSDPHFRGTCATWTKGKSHLYLHPQQFSGEVLKNDIKTVAEAILTGMAVRLRWVDVRDTVYYISDQEYDEYLDGKAEDIQRDLFENFGTTRRTTFLYTYEVCRVLVGKYGLRRIGIREDAQATAFIRKIMEKMAENHLIVMERGGDLIRSLNKTEKRRIKSWQTLLK